MCIGEIKDVGSVNTKNPNRLKSGNVKYEFVPLPQMNFEIIEFDVSEYKSTHEIIKKLNLENNIYRIILTGVRNIDVEKLSEEIKLSSDNIVEIIDNTRLDYNLKEIAMEKNLKGVFTQKMLEELEKYPENEDDIYKAIEIVYSNM